jgi:predicted branched-subunit amino acid permease
MGLVAGLTSQLGKLSSDALIQRDVAESVRTSVFAWSETALQVAWVVGGALGIALPLQPPLGFGVVAAVLVALLTQAVRIHLRGSVLPDAARAPDGRSVRL